MTIIKTHLIGLMDNHRYAHRDQSDIVIGLVIYYFQTIDKLSFILLAEFTQRVTHNKWDCLLAENRPVFGLVNGLMMLNFSILWFTSGIKCKANFKITIVYKFEEKNSNMKCFNKKNKTSVHVFKWKFNKKIEILLRREKQTSFTYIHKF